MIGGLKFEDFVLSIVERYLIQCPLFGASVKRASTVLGIFPHIILLCWGFPYNGSLTCVSILLSQHIGNLNKFVIELGGQGGRGKRNA